MTAVYFDEVRIELMSTISYRYGQDFMSLLLQIKATKLWIYVPVFENKHCEMDLFKLWLQKKVV